MFSAKYVQIGAKIRYYRTIRALEQIALAEKLGITSQYLSKIERGAAKPSTDLLFLIAQVLNVDVITLMKGESEL
ncbi:MAG: helix-turn-helix transcriptional regulator [Phascolarctobacterium sp.]|nr:helix-turn-helix transcriptional regulator [Phascolarctobacterium sp.]